MIKISTAKIGVASGHPLKSIQPKRKFRIKTINSTQYTGLPLVMPNQDGKTYDLYLGAALLHKALQNGIKEIECELLTAPNEQKTHELFLLENYLCNTISALELGTQFRLYREEYQLNQLDLSRRLGISPGTVHHYESLAANLDENLGIELEKGHLQFKEARCIADLNSHARQRAVAQPFIDGRLSSVQVEKLVSIVRALGDVPASKIVDKFLELVDTVGSEVTSEQVMNEIQRSNQSDSDEPLENRILRLAGSLADLTLQKIPESKRLRYISSLRILDSRLQMALASLYGPANVNTPAQTTADKKLKV